MAHGARGGAAGVPRNRTIVFFHAHPDDEVLLTGGTMARLAAEGHRVVLVTATAGEAGLTADDLRPSLADVRLRELHRSAEALGCARIEVLGYADSGSDRGRPPSSGTFAATPVEQAAARLAAVLREESADVVTGYDPAGGYGHPDHVQVHRVAGRAAELAGTPLRLDATVDRRALQRALRVAGAIRPRSSDFAPARFDDLYSDPAVITHRVDVRGFLDQKRAAMRAHASQTTAGTPAEGAAAAERGLAWMLRLPRPLYRLAFGREWFVEHGRAAARPLLGDILDGLPTVD
jgi:LmbE family N-acetylglucosaminyl deacetylase